MSGESGSWTVDLNEDGSGIVFDFDEIQDTGVETFTTAMPLDHSLAFAHAIIGKVLEAHEGHDDDEYPG
jgi:hypothetical protein